MNDRQSDNWDAMLAIADLLGGNWPTSARAIALSLSDTDDEETIQTLLLSRIREVLASVPDDRKLTPTDHLIECLNEDQEAPWANWAKGKGITPEKLARILKPFGVKSFRIWDGGKKVRGYTRESLEPVFDRYLSPAPPKNDSDPANES
jgi:putative DNA primase/helicase